MREGDRLPDGLHRWRGPGSAASAARKAELRLPVRAWLSAFLVRHRAFISGLLCGVLLVFAVRLLINRTTLVDVLVAPVLLPDTIEKTDAMVVLGAGVIGDCIPNQYAVRRVLLAAQLWREHWAPLVVFTGGSSEGSCPVAVAMAQMASAVGISESAIRVETTSRSTRENGQQTALLLRALGARRLLLVTDRLHMRRAAVTFQKEGFDVRRASVPIYVGHTSNVDMLRAGVREMAALTYYWMRGWTGSNVATGVAAKSTDHSQNAMQNHRQHPSGPIVILGASYAGGWDLKSLGGVPVVNRGLDGEESTQMLERFERDVVAAQPRAVVVWGFINDIFRAPPEDIDAALGRIRENYTRMITRARTQGIEPILATEVTTVSRDSWTEAMMSWVGPLLGKESYQDRINRHVIEANSWLLDFAKQEGLIVLDFQRILADQNGRRRREFAQEDGSHITAAGYAALTAFAQAVLPEHLVGR